MGVASAVSTSDLQFVLRLLTPVNRLVMRLAAETGLRISDCLSLTVQQLRTACNNGGYVSVFESKTGKRRRVHLSVGLRGDMVSYVSPRSPYVFPNRFDYMRPRTRQAVWKDVNRAAEALRFDLQVSPHSARKYAAQEKLKAVGGNIKAVQRWLCHSDGMVTAIYVLAEHAHMGTKYCGKIPSKRG